MKTLNRKVTATFFKNADGFEVLRRQWSLRGQGHGAMEHLLYLVLQGKDYTKAFPAPTNPTKVNNGAFGEWGFHRAFHGTRQILAWVHDGTIDQRIVSPAIREMTALLNPETAGKLRDLLPEKVIQHGYTQALGKMDGARIHIPHALPFEPYHQERATIMLQRELTCAA